jgi:outer membrane protein
MKTRLAVLALAALSIIPSAKAQSGTAAGSMKIGVINVQVALQSTAEGKAAAAELQSKFAPRQTELDDMRKQIEDLQTRLRNGQTTLSDEEKARLTREGDSLTRTYQRKQQESQDDFNDAQQEIVNTLGRKMMDVLDKYSKEGGYAVILDTSAQQSPIVFAAAQIDVTEEIVRLYDQTYGVKSGGGAGTSSATPKPAPKPTPATPGTPKQ